MDCPNLRAIPKFEGRGDQIDDDGRKQLIDVMQFGAVNIADKEAEVECCCQDDKKTKNHFFQIHAKPLKRLLITDSL